MNVTTEEDFSAFLLRQRFLSVISKGWYANNHHLEEISCVYAMIAIDVDIKIKDIVYIGSTTKLNSRYKSHKVPDKIQAENLINLMYFLPMRKGFYDYEIKLIKKLQPLYNKQHK
jgi:hypothetical protein